MTKKVLILACGSIPVYRKELYEIIALNNELTIIADNIININNATTIKSKTISISSLKFQFTALYHLIFKDYDRVLVVSNFHYIFNIFSLLLLSNSKVISWGFWPTQSSFINKIRHKIVSIGVPQIFYCQSHFDSFRGSMIDSSVCHVATNTVFVKPHNIPNNYRNSILFVGTLNKRKGLLEFLELCIDDIKKTNFIFKIIGDGPIYSELQNFIEHNQLNDKVILLGKINCPEILFYHYSSSICEFSPLQAGLSVQRAFGHGIPFLTTKFAISGGEIDSIIDGNNGFLADDLFSLKFLLFNLIDNPDLASFMRKNALNFYNDNLTIKKTGMVFLNVLS